MPGGSELPIGVGVHTGIISMGTVMSALRERGTYHDVQPFGDNVNVTSRLCGHAKTRHALISESTLVAAGVPTEGLELREFTVRGRRAPISALAINRDRDVLPTRSPRI